MKTEGLFYKSTWLDCGFDHSADWLTRGALGFARCTTWLGGPADAAQWMGLRVHGGPVT